jgi:polygalacturonase
MKYSPHARRQFLARLLAAGGTIPLLPLYAAEEPPPGPRQFSVREWGALGDGKRLDTAALQRAIDSCHRAGGGTVLVPPGAYLTGTLFLKSRVALHLDHGAVLLGSTQLKDYPLTPAAIRSYTDNYTDKSLIYAENQERIAITGQGIIDGQGAAFPGPYKVRPYLLRFIGCRDVTVRDITILNSPMWVQHYLACDRVLLSGLTVISHCNSNNDGIDIDGCRQVRISDCDISSGDDAIVLKSTLNRPCQDIVISNCILKSDCNAFKLGTESNGGFQNVVLSNCVIHATRLAGLALELVDGGLCDGISISNVTMREVRCPIFIRLGNRARTFEAAQAKPAMGQMRNLQISHVQAEATDPIGCSITGLPGHPVEQVTLDHIRLLLPGGGTEAQAAREIPEQETKYPEYAMFGTLPASGLYCRHVRGLALQNIEIDFKTRDERPGLVCEDVAQLELDGWNPAQAPSTNPAVRLFNVRQANIRSCRSPQGTKTFVAVEGPESNRIRLLGNDFKDAEKGVEAPVPVETPPGQ